VAVLYWRSDWAKARHKWRRRHGIEDRHAADYDVGRKVDDGIGQVRESQLGLFTHLT
jgi:hypothetical protein